MNATVRRVQQPSAIKLKIDALRVRLNAKRGIAAIVGLTDELDLLLEIVELMDLQTTAAADVITTRAFLGDRGLGEEANAKTD